MSKPNKKQMLQPKGATEDDKNALKKMVLKSSSGISEAELTHLMNKFDAECQISEADKFKQIMAKMPKTHPAFNSNPFKK